MLALGFFVRPSSNQEMRPRAALAPKIWWPIVIFPKILGASLKISQVTHVVLDSPKIPRSWPWRWWEGPRAGPKPTVRPTPRSWVTPPAGRPKPMGTLWSEKSHAMGDGGNWPWDTMGYHGSMWVKGGDKDWSAKVTENHREPWEEDLTWNWTQPFSPKTPGGSNGSPSLLPRCSVLAAPTAADIGISFPPPLVFPKP